MEVETGVMQSKIKECLELPGTWRESPLYPLEEAGPVRHPDFWISALQNYDKLSF